MAEFSYRDYFPIMFSSKLIENKFCNQRIRKHFQIISICFTVYYPTENIQRNPIATNLPFLPIFGNRLPKPCSRKSFSNHDGWWWWWYLHHLLNRTNWNSSVGMRCCRKSHYRCSWTAWQVLKAPNIFRFNLFA